MVKIVSWNVNSIRVRLPHLIELDRSVKPDIVMLQETKSTDENFPEEEISSLGYQIIKKGQKSYNGVAILSKAPIKKITDTLKKNPRFLKHIGFGMEKMRHKIDKYRELNVLKEKLFKNYYEN